MEKSIMYYAYLQVTAYAEKEGNFNDILSIIYL